jgi:glycosyltransferase 2 family protein
MLNTTYLEHDNQKRQRPPWLPSKARLARSLLYLIIIGLAVYILLPQLTSIKESIRVLRSMSPWLVGLALLAQIGSYVARGYLIKAIVDLGKTRLSLGRGVLIALAAGSVGLVGGWVGAAAATYRWIERGEDTSKEAVLAGILPPLLNEIMLVLATIIGLVYLLIDYHLTRGQMVGISLSLGLVILGLLVILYAMRNQEIIEPFLLRSADQLMHVLRGTYDPAVIRKAIEDLYRGLALLANKAWIRPALGAAMNVGFNMLSLYFLFLAAGYRVHPGILVAGVGLAYLLGKVAYISPGGVGIMEGGMAAIYSSLGVPQSIGIVVILSYRLFSFWLPTLLGFAAAGYLENK